MGWPCLAEIAWFQRLQNDMECIILLQETELCSRDTENPSDPKDGGSLESISWKMVSEENSETQVCNYLWKGGARGML